MRIKVHGILLLPSALYDLQGDGCFSRTQHPLWGGSLLVRWRSCTRERGEEEGAWMASVAGSCWTGFGCSAARSLLMQGMCVYGSRATEAAEANSDEERVQRLGRSQRRRSSAVSCLVAASLMLQLRSQQTCHADFLSDDPSIVLGLWVQVQSYCGIGVQAAGGLWVTRGEEAGNTIMPGNQPSFFPSFGALSKVPSQRKVLKPGSSHITEKTGQITLD